MSIKAIIAGLLGVVLLNGFTYFNEAVLHQPPMVNNHMPIAIFGGLIFFLIAINPLLARFYRPLFFTAREVVVALALILASAAIPGSNLMRYFTNLMVQPHYLVKTNPSWQKHDLLERVPEGMMAQPGDDAGEVINGFVRGLSTGVQNISFGDIPWDAFEAPLKLWIPIILILWIGLIGLSLVVHKQWAHHEQLPYPIARFVSWLLPNENSKAGSVLADVFRSKIFWLGLGIVFLIHMNNYWALWMDHWWPGKWVPVKTTFSNLVQFSNVSEFLSKGGFNNLIYFQLYFSIIGFSYFLSKEVSLSMGLGPFLYMFVIAWLKGMNISAQSGTDFANNITLGAYLAMAIMVLYTGRFFYWSVFRQAVFLKGGPGESRDVIWGARVALASFMVLLVVFVRLGLDWQIALIFLLVLIVIFVIMSRIIAETGVFLIQAGIVPAVSFLALMGPQSLGINLILMLFFLSTVLIIDPRDTLMPFIVNSLRTLDFAGEKRGRVAVLSGVALVVGLAVAIPATLYFQYNYGASNAKDDYAAINVPRMPFETANTAALRLKSQGLLEEAESISGFERFVVASPEKMQNVWALVSGFVLLLVFMFGRLRFAAWPLHPVMFLVWATFPARKIWASLLIGWFIKFCVTKYGGEGTYRKLQPLMIGLIAGDMLGGGVSVLIGVLYFIFQGQAPPIEPFLIFVP